MAEENNLTNQPEKTKTEEQIKVASTTPAELSQKPSPKLPLIFISVTIFLILAIGGFFLYKANSNQSDLFPSPTESSQPSTAPLTLDLDSPAEGELAVNDEILVRGVTLPDTVVLAYTDTDDASVTSDDSGKFETTLVLAEGINTVNVTAFSDDGQEKTVSLDIVRDIVEK